MRISGKLKFAFLAASSIGALQSGAAMAQEVEQNSEQEVGSEGDSEIVVSGIRSSLESAINRKRDADQVIDTIEAEDIQKLPDDTAARALSRVTGVQITQRNGVGSEIQLRGLSQVFVSLNNTSFVGSPSITDRGDAGRNNALEDLPSELFGGFDVIKTPTADNIEGGIGGSVNLRTRAPLDLDDTTVGVSLRGNYGELSGQLDPRGSILFGKNFDDKFGFYVNATYNETTTRNDSALWGNWSFIRHNPFDPALQDNAAGTFGRFFFAGPDGEFSNQTLGQVFESGPLSSDPSNPNFDPAQAASACTPFCWVNAQLNEGFDPILLFNNGTEVQPILAPQQIENRIVENSRETFGLNGSVQFRPSDDLNIRIDGFYTTFTETANTNAFRLNTQGDAFNTAVLFSPNSLINSGNELLEPVVSQNFSLLRGGFLPSIFNDNGFVVRQAGEVGLRDAETLNLRFNTNWQASDNLNVDLTATYGQNEFNSTFIQQELRQGSGNTNGAFNGGNRRPDVLGNSPQLVPPPRFGFDITPGTGPVGNIFFPQSATNRDNFILAFVSLFEDVFEADEFSLQADFDYRFDSDFFTSLEFGARFTDRSNERTVRRGIGQNFEPRCNAPGTEGINDLTACIAAGGSFLTADRIGVDPFRELQDVTAGQFDVTGLIGESIVVAGANNGGLFQGIGGDLPRVFLSGDPRAYSDPIADLQAVWGIRAVDDPSNNFRVDEQTLAGYAKLNFESGPLRGNIGARLVETETQAVTFTPSAGAEQQFLFSQIFDEFDAVGNTVSYTDFLPSLNLRYDLSDDIVARFGAARVIARPDLTDISTGVFIRSVVDATAVRGNPDLDPFRATNLDLSFEYYLGNSGLLNVGLFYKDIDSFITTDVEVEALLGNFGTFTPFNVFSPVNGSAEVRGIEIGYQQPFTFLPAPFDGFGALVNYTYADSDSPDSEFGLPELSEHSYNLIGYYEKGGFSTRLAYNWRDERLFRANGVGGNPEFIKAFGLLDFSMSYQFTDGIAAFVEVNNITKENLESFTLLEERRLGFTQFDRTFSFGIRGSF